MMASSRPLQIAPSQKTLVAACDTGPGSVEYVRRQLTGAWTLDRFETADAAGQFHPVKASATLTYDQYGNMNVSGNLLEPMPGQQPEDLQSMLTYSGRIRSTPKTGIPAARPGRHGRSRAAGHRGRRHMIRKYVITHDAIDDHLRRRAGQADGANNLQEVKTQVDRYDRYVRSEEPASTVGTTRLYFHSYRATFARQLARHAATTDRSVRSAFLHAALEEIAVHVYRARSARRVERHRCGGRNVTSILPDCVRTETLPSMPLIVTAPESFTATTVAPGGTRTS